MYPRPITRGHSVHEVRINVDAFQHVLHHIKPKVLLLIPKQLGHTFLRYSVHTQTMCSNGTYRTQANPIVPWTVNQWSSMIKLHTWSITCGFQLNDDLLEHRSLSIKVQPFLNWLNHSSICVISKAILLKVC